MIRQLPLNIDVQRAYGRCGEVGHFMQSCTNARLNFCWDCGRRNKFTVDFCRRDAPGNKQRRRQDAGAAEMSEVTARHQERKCRRSSLQGKDRRVRVDHTEASGCLLLMYLEADGRARGRRERKSCKLSTRGAK